MKRKISRLLTLIIVVCMLISQVNIFVNAAATFAGGSGTAGDPYLIATANQLNNIRYYSDKHFKIVNNIDLSAYSSGEGWDPINSFNGILYGGNYTISNLTISRVNELYVGLFGTLLESSLIENVVLTNVKITGGSYVGGIAGLSAGSILYSSLAGEVTGDYRNVGGLVGYNTGNITESNSSANVHGYDYVGGIAGWNEGNISKTRSSGEITGENTATGGLVGVNYSKGISNSINTGTVNGYDYVGGLVGWNYDDCVIGHSGSNGSVTGRNFVGGLVGINQGGIIYSTSSGDVSGQQSVGGLVGDNTNLISNSYSSGSVQGNIFIGGLVGSAASVYAGSHDTFIAYSYSTGRVSASSTKGGLVGYVSDPSYLYDVIIMNSYWDYQSSGVNTSAGTGSNYYGYTTANMKNKDSFTNWDFKSTWGINDIDNGGYPFLQWQGYDYTGPVLSELTAFHFTLDGATFTFNTNEKGKCAYLVYYDDEEDADAYLLGDVVETSVGTNTINITGLRRGESYIVYAVAYDEYGNGSNLVGMYFDTNKNTIPSRKTTVESTESVILTYGNPYSLNLDDIFEDFDKDTLTYKVAINGGGEIPANSSYSYTPTTVGNHTLVFKANDGFADSNDTYTVSITVNVILYNLSVQSGVGGTISKDSSGKYEAANDIEIEATPLPGYSFYRWTASDGGSFKDEKNQITTYTMPANDSTVTAEWSINSYELTFDTAGGTIIAPITQEYNSNVTKPADPVREGYTFAGWDVPIPMTMPSNDMAITALWTINKYTILFNTDGGTEVSSITQDYGTDLIKPADPVREGYTFLRWDKVIPDTMPSGDMTITALWEEVLYGDVNGDGAVNSQDVTFLRRYLIGGWGVTIDPVASDVNKDGFINNQDVTLLRRYLIGGWGVTLN